MCVLLRNIILKFIDYRLHNSKRRKDDLTKGIVRVETAGRIISLQSKTFIRVSKKYRLRTILV